eukprot:Ihof_evm3s504 gene=Ihof_evmTU3s504
MAETNDYLTENTKLRVKIYELDDDCQWSDKGCGQVALVNTILLGGWAIVVRSEDPDDGGAVLLESKLQTSPNIYKRQNETLIVWEEPLKGKDPRTTTEFALSFQDKEGCEEMWEKIEERVNDYSTDRTVWGKRGVDGDEGEGEVVDNEEEEENEEGVDGEGRRRKKQKQTEDSDDEILEQIAREMDMELPLATGNGFVESVDDDADNYLDLPPPTLDTLDELAQRIQSTPPYIREKLANTIIAKEYFQKLIPIFKQCEEGNNKAALSSLFTIFKCLVLLPESSIIELIVEKDLLMDVMGVLEYDPDIPGKQHHREFLRDKAKFREAIRVENKSLLDKIHTTYRLTYLKDVVLPRLIDDPNSNTLVSFIFFNNIDIVQTLQQDRAFMIQLFDKLSDVNTKVADRIDVLVFLREFCNLSKSLQVGARLQFFKDLVHYGLLMAIPTALLHPNTAMRIAAAEVIDHVLQQDPSLVRNHIMEENTLYKITRGPMDGKANPGLLMTLVQAFISETDTGVRTHLCEILRVLLDPDSMETLGHCSEFTGYFYEHCFLSFIEPLSNVPDQRQARTAYVNDWAPLLYFLVELLTSYVRQHQQNIRPQLLRTCVIEKISTLVSSNHKYLALGALRFLRVLINEKEELYIRYLIKHQCLEGLVCAFEENATRLNMINSSVLDFCEVLRKDNVKLLLKHLVENYSERLKPILPSYNSIHLKYEQNEDVATFDDN